MPALTVFPGSRGVAAKRLVREDDLHGPWEELVARASEHGDFASKALHLARVTLKAIAAGQISVAIRATSEIERLAPREQGRAKSAEILARMRLAELAGAGCPDAEVLPGHGTAA